MPSTGQFLSGFGLVPGGRIDGYVIISSTGTEESISRYRKYRYEFTVELASIGYSNVDNLLSAMSQITSQIRSIFATRNYYNCSIEPVKRNNLMVDSVGHVTMKLIGYGTR